MAVMVIVVEEPSGMKSLSRPNSGGRVPSAPWRVRCAVCASASGPLLHGSLAWLSPAWAPSRSRAVGPSSTVVVSVVVCCHLGVEWVAGALGHMRRRLVRSNLPALFRFAPRRPSAAHDQSIPGRRCASFEFTRCARRTRAARATTARGRCIPRARPRSAASRARGGHTSSGQDTTSLSALLLRHRTLTKGERTVERGEQHQNTNPILVRPTPTHTPSRP